MGFKFQNLKSYKLAFNFTSDSGILNYLAGKDLHYINNQMLEATIEAHTKGLIPIVTIGISRIDTNHLGKLMYTFMFACALSAYVLGVNPFDQPAVSEYKNRMLELLKNEE